MSKLITLIALMLSSTVQPTLFSSVSFDSTEFEDTSRTIPHNVDDEFTIDDILSTFTAIDTEDGDISDSLYVITDNYTGNEKVITHDHLVVIGVTDSGDSETTFAFYIHNYDISPPIFEVIESTLNIPQYSRLSQNLPQISAIDNLEGDISSDIAITGLDSIITSELGAYTLTYTVSDSSGNTTTQVFTVNVVDSVSPVIDGPLEIVKRSDTILDGQFYLQYFSAEDDHDGIVTNRMEVISDEYMGNANNPGTYDVVVSVKDLQGNYSNHTLTIKVVKDMLPRLIIDDYYWVVENNYKYNDDDFIETLKFVKDLPNYQYIFTTTYDNYTNFYESLGTYQKNFSLLSSTGEEFTKDITLEIVESNYNLVDDTPGVIESNSQFIIGGLVITAVLTFLIIGIVQSKK